MDNFMVRHAGTMFAMVILAGTLLGCRTVYVNSVHNQRTGGAVSTEMKEQKAETTADFGKTVTTNAEVPLQ